MAPAIDPKPLINEVGTRESDVRKATIISCGMQMF
jgi:hypothetical protein